MPFICEVCGLVEHAEDQQPEEKNALQSRHLLHVCEDCQQNRQQDF